MNIVTSGCSFSVSTGCIDYTRFGMKHNDWQTDSGYKSWPYHLEDSIDGKVYNKAMPGAGNGYITRATISKCEELLSKGKKIDYVFVQWTSFDRVDLLMDRNFIVEGSDDWNLQCHFDSYFDTSFDVTNGKPHKGEDIIFYHERLEEFNSNHSWVKHSYSDNSVQKYWYKYYSTPESSMVYGLENMTRLMWYLESKKIDYKFFCGWNTFIESGLQKIPREPFDVRFLWNMIDWKKWWFHKASKSATGGITEWSQDYFDNEADCYVTGERKADDGSWLDQHPSDIAHKKFAEEVVLKWIKKN